MRTLYTLIFLFTLFYSSQVLGQFADNIRTGRPGQAIGPYAVGKNVLQFQSGIDVGRNEIDFFGYQETYIHPNTVIRYGITKKIEINTAIGYQYQKNEATFPLNDFSGINLLSLGSRINILEGQNKIPSIGIQLTAKLPFLATDYAIDRIAPRALLIIHQPISNAFSLMMNGGISYSGNNAPPRGNYVLNLSYSINEKWGIFAENYGDFGNGAFNHFWDTGFSYLTNSNLQFDLYSGIGNNSGVLSYFGSIGLSWRITQWHSS